MKKLSPLVTSLFLVLMLASTGIQGDLYKWVDEQGNVTYSQQKPPDQKAETIELKGIQSPDPDAGQKLDSLRDRADTARKDREVAASESAATKDRDERLKKNCEIARQNVRILKTSARVQDKKEDGSTVYLDADGVAAKLKQAEQQVQDYCN